MRLIRKLPPCGQPDAPAAAWCHYCLGEIYEGEDYYRVEGQAVCEHCLPRLAEDYFGACRRTGGR